MLAAFDTVDHDLLLTILQNKYGITDTAYYNGIRATSDLEVWEFLSMMLILPLEHSTILFLREVLVGQTFLWLTVPQ